MLLQQRVRVGKLEKVRFADRMLPHISWTGSFQLEEHRPMVRSLISQMGYFTLEEPLWVPSVGERSNFKKFLRTRKIMVMA